MSTKTAKLRAYHGDPAIKAKYLARVRAHAAADEIVQGITWGDGKGCAVGCTLHDYRHESYETELGVPIILARLEDRFFEGMKPADAQPWPARFLEAIPVGADLSMVWPKFAHWMLVDEKDGVIRFAKTDRTRDAILNVGALFARLIAGDSVSQKDWRADADAAAAAWRADAAAWRADAAAAWRAADAADAARHKTYKRMAEKLAELMADAPVDSAVLA